MSNPRTFTIDVPNIGTFTFRRRTIGDSITIQARYDTLLAGCEAPSSYLDLIASALATYRTLAVSWPPGWEPEKVAQMDAVEDDRITELVTIYGALSAREDEFRPPAKRRFQKMGEGRGEQPGSLVPAEIQPAADRPQVPERDAG